MHTCALICSAVGGLILSHYCKSCWRNGACACGCQDECTAIGSSRLSFSSGRGLSCALKKKKEKKRKKGIKKTKLLSWALAKCAGLSVWVVKEIKDALLFAVSTFPPSVLLLPPLWMRKWKGLCDRPGEWDLRQMNFQKCAQPKTGIMQSIDFA